MKIWRGAGRGNKTLDFKWRMVTWVAGNIDLFKLTRPFWWKHRTVCEEPVDSNTNFQSLVLWSTSAKYPGPGWQWDTNDHNIRPFSHTSMTSIYSHMAFVAPHHPFFISYWQIPNIRLLSHSNSRLTWWIKLHCVDPQLTSQPFSLSVWITAGAGAN